MVDLVCREIMWCTIYTVVTCDEHSQPLFHASNLFWCFFMASKVSFLSQVMNSAQPATKYSWFWRSLWLSVNGWGFRNSRSTSYKSIPSFCLFLKPVFADSLQITFRPTLSWDVRWIITPQISAPYPLIDNLPKLNCHPSLCPGVPLVEDIHIK